MFCQRVGDLTLIISMIFYRNLPTILVTSLRNRLGILAGKFVTIIKSIQRMARG